MDDPELLEEFIRVDRDADQVRIMVREIHWDGPHTPVSTWAICLELPTTATETEVTSATANILDDGRYVRFCPDCEQRKPAGWKYNDRTCHGCAANDEVVH